MRLSEFFRELRRKLAETGEPLARTVRWERTTSHNGYVREKALRELAHAPEPEDWPYALERLNDWVPQVRSQAGLLAEKLVKDGHVSALHGWPDQLSALARKSRGRPDDALSTIILALSAKGGLAAMWPNLGRDFRELAVQTLLSHDRLPDLLASRKLKDLDPVSIQLILREQGIVTDEQVATLIDHPHPGTRKAALESAAARGKSEVDLLHLALFDRSSRVRTTAQFLLGKRGVDTRSIYLSRLDPKAIEGFCEVALAEDIGRLHELFGISGSRQRTAIAQALVRLDDTSLVIPMLSDTSGKVRRPALGLALKQPGAVSLEARQTLCQSGNHGVKKVGAQLLMSQSRWESLIQILKFIGNEDESICAMALDYLGGWLRWASQSPTIPDSTTFKRAVAVTSYMEARMPEALRTELKQILAWISSRIQPT